MHPTMSAARPAPPVTAASFGPGRARSMRKPCNMPRPPRCSATSPTRPSPMPGSSRASIAATASSSCIPMARTASWPSSGSSTPSALSRCSSIWWSFPTAACRRCPSPGTVGRWSRAGNAGSICIRISGSAFATNCTGPGRRRTGTSCAPTAIRPTCARATTPRRIALPAAGRRSASAARPVTVPVPTICAGRSRAAMMRTRA